MPIDEIVLAEAFYTKSVILGGLDGVMVAVGVVCACEGGDLSIDVMIIVGVATVLAQALNIGIGEYLSSKAHRQFVLAEKRRVMWEFQHNPNQKKQIMADLFENRGMSREDAQLVTQKMADYDRFFVDLLVTEELHLVLPEDDDATLLFDSLVMFLSFAGLGVLPILVYGLVPLKIIEPAFVQLSFLVLAGALLVFLGGLKTTFSSVVWAYSSCEALLMGIAVGGFAYAVGNVVSSAIGSF